VSGLAFCNGITEKGSPQYSDSSSWADHQVCGYDKPLSTNMVLHSFSHLFSKRKIFEDAVSRHILEEYFALNNASANQTSRLTERTILATLVFS
jgi:hypothetical protein